jgi:hypothetical protein
MVELFGIYALLLTAWGLYRKRRAAAAQSDEALAAAALYDAPATRAIPTRERGAAARRHLGARS